MNWDNIDKILDTYTQYKHYQLLFLKKGWSKKTTARESKKILYKAVRENGFIGAAMTTTSFEEWLSLHQIDGNNYTFVYNLQTKPSIETLESLYGKRDDLVKRIWEYDPTTPDDGSEAIPNLNAITLIGIHRVEEKGKYIFSFLAPCYVVSNNSGASLIHKRMFFAHCVLYVNSNDMKVVFNPTTNLLHVDNVEKGKGHDWTPIANAFFKEMRKYIGDHKIKAPTWFPLALHKFAEEASDHNNEEITRLSVNAADDIKGFAYSLLQKAGLDPENDQAMVMHLSQDIQLSFEAQLVEKYGIIKEENSFDLFKQRSDGFTHVINVEAKETLGGNAAQAARKSRQDGDIDLLGVILNNNDRMYKLLVEQGTDAYLLRGPNVFIEEEVADIVIRQLNEYRVEIQATSLNHEGHGDEDKVITSE